MKPEASHWDPCPILSLILLRGNNRTRWRMNNAPPSALRAPRDRSAAIGRLHASIQLQLGSSFFCLCSFSVTFVLLTQSKVGQNAEMFYKACSVTRLEAQTFPQLEPPDKSGRLETALIRSFTYRELLWGSGSSLGGPGQTGPRAGSCSVEPWSTSDPGPPGPRGRSSREKRGLPGERVSKGPEQLGRHHLTLGTQQRVAVISPPE